jgi:eukaryotic-like serine/threonine-protein kinase
MFHMEQTVISDRYTLVELLGEGGMARVYLAHDDVLDRYVALKVLRERYADDDSFAERFRSEARNAASLTHPGIVQVYDQGRDEDGTYYIAMEYVPGGTLKDRINARGPLDPEEAAGIAWRIAEALGAAHERGIVHRDVTSQNILLGATGETKVVDFGIARAASSKTVTETNVVLGTAAYMSPEQVRSERVGPASDLYSLGVVLYEMLTGELPYKADDPIATAIKHLEEPPPRPKELNPAVPEGLDALTVKLLAKNPEDRYPSAAELAEDLQRMGEALPLPTAPLADQSTVEATTAPMSAPERRTRTTSASEAVAAGGRSSSAEKSMRQRTLLPLFGLLLVFVLLGGLAWVFSPSDVARSTTPQNKPPQNKPQASDAPPKVEVPDVVGMSREEARRRLDEAGLELGSQQESESETVAEGSVIEQDPAAGTEAERNSAVDVVLSTGLAQEPSPSTSSSASASASSSASASASASTSASAPASTSASASASATPTSAAPANASPVGATKVKEGAERATLGTDVPANQNQPPPSGAKKLQVKPIQDEPAPTRQGEPAN